MEQTCAVLEASGSFEYPGTSKVNRKYKGPDGLGLDIRVRGWDEQIKGQDAAVPAHPDGLAPRITGRQQRREAAVLSGPLDPFVRPGLAYDSSESQCRRSPPA